MNIDHAKTDELFECKIPGLIEDADFDSVLVDGYKYDIQNGMIRGLESDVKKMLNAYGLEDDLKPIQTEFAGIVEVDYRLLRTYTEPIVAMAEIIKNFPSLKIIAFLEDWDTSTIYFVYSESGYDHITAIHETVPFDKKDELSWHLNDSPVEWWIEYKERWEPLLEQWFPFEEKWEDNNYYTIQNGVSYRASIKKSATTIIPWDSPKLWKLKKHPSFGNVSYIVQYLGNETEIHCPEKIGNDFICGFWDRTKETPENYKKIEKIFISRTNNISDSYGVIGKNAFSGCTSLKEIYLPKGVDKICSGAFAGCSSLQTVVFTEARGYEGVIVEDSAFADCSSLQNVVFPGIGKCDFGKNVFKNCSAIKDIWAWNEKTDFSVKSLFADSPNCTVHGPNGKLEQSNAECFVPLTADDFLRWLGQSNWPIEAQCSTCDPYKNIAEIGEWLTFSGNKLFRQGGGRFKSYGAYPGKLHVKNIEISAFGNLFDIKMKELTFGYSEHLCKFDVYPKGYAPKEEPQEIEYIEYNNPSKQQFAGKIFVLDNQVMLEVCDLIKERGGEIKESVVLKTDYLIINPAITEETKKRQKAKEILGKGKSQLKIITIHEFYDMVIE